MLLTNFISLLPSFLGIISCGSDFPLGSYYPIICHDCHSLIILWPWVTSTIAASFIWGKRETLFQIVLYPCVSDILNMEHLQMCPTKIRRFPSLRHGSRILQSSETTRTSVLSGLSVLRPLTNAIFGGLQQSGLRANHINEIENA